VHNSKAKSGPIRFGAYEDRSHIRFAAYEDRSHTFGGIRRQTKDHTVTFLVFGLWYLQVFSKLFESSDSEFEVRLCVASNPKP
jgi:hypothetical protein